jgi:hypothetical protein
VLIAQRRIADTAIIVHFGITILNKLRSALQIFTKPILAMCIMVALPQLVMAQVANRPLMVKELPAAIDATVSRLHGNIRVSLNSCRKGEIGEEICYYSLSSNVILRAESSASGPSLNIIEVELPPDKENTKRLYRTGFLLAQVLMPDISDAAYAALKGDLLKALKNVFGDAHHQIGNIEFILLLGIDEPRPWWKRLFSKEPKSKLQIFIHQPS